MLHNHDFTRPGGLHPALRARIEDRIERLIALLDAADGDPDLEDGDEDCCVAGDDRVFSGSVIQQSWTRRDLATLIGSEDDAEHDYVTMRSPPTVDLPIIQLGSR